MKKEKVIVIVGPTASGKSNLGIELAKRINGEIISCDSMQIYKGLDVGTAKVTKEETKQVKHHLIDIIDINETFSVADFKSLCYDKIDEIIKCGKTPILVGGTGLYVNSVILNMNFDNTQDNDEINEYRKYLYNLAKEKSNEYVYNMLVDVDEQSANLIHKNNLRRVVRALEIAKFGKENKSSHMSLEEKRIKNMDSKYEFLVYFIDIPRDILYERINDRVDKMIQNPNMLKEARYLYENRKTSSKTCLQAIGYKEFFDYFDGNLDIDECILKLKQNSRNYAKRQITWFKNKTKNKKLDGMLDINENIEIIVNDI